MFLDKVVISGYRSINKLEVDFNQGLDNKLFVLFGINETGKSSIIKAISLLDNTAEYNYTLDCEKQIAKVDGETVVSYLYTIDDDKDLIALIKEDLPENLCVKLKIIGAKKVLTFKSDGTSSECYWIQFDDIKYEDFFFQKTTKVIVEQIPDDDSATDYVPLTSEDLDNLVYEKLTPLLDETRPKILFWKGDPKHLINEAINLDSFSADPSMSIPLRNIFALAGYKSEKLTTTLSRVQSSSDERSELEEEVSDCITAHINKLWPEHKINLKLRIESDHLCHISVEDKDNTKPKYSLLQRSDGFKHFISILLTLSAEHKTQQLENNIILLDEPEISLHPSSIRYLRNELINISKNNIVLVASHSIYMVDKEHLDRHYTVSKEEGYTSINQVDPSNPLQEEVIYEALGTSIYEILMPNVILVEGRTDKELLDAVLLKLKTKLSLPDFQIVGASGVSHLPKYAKFFNQRFIDGFVLCDSDQAGRAAIRNVLAENSSFEGRVFELKDISNIEKPHATIEDYIPKDIVLEAAQKLYPQPVEVVDDNKPILKEIERYKRSHNINLDGDMKELKVEILQRVLRDLKNKRFTIPMTNEKYSALVSVATGMVDKINQKSE